MEQNTGMLSRGAGKKGSGRPAGGGAVSGEMEVSGTGACGGCKQHELTAMIS